MTSKSEREYRSMTLAAEQRAEGEEERMVVSGYASTFNEPYLLYKDEDIEVYEKVDPAAFDDADMEDVILQYDHQGRVFARKSNNTLIVEADDRGLFTSADLGGTDIGRALFQEIAGGYSDKMSFGFTVSEDKRETINREDGKTVMVRTLLKIGKVYDVSVVSLPANPGTVIAARFLDGAIEEIKAERLAARELEEKRAAVMEKVNRIMEGD